MARNIAGPPVEGDDCYGRDEFLRELELGLQRGSVLLLAPRRWGKTSVLKTFRGRSPSSRHYFDLYDVERAPDFVAEVAATTASPVSRVRKWVGSVLGRSLDRVKEIRIAEVALELRDKLGSSGESSWQRSASALFASIPRDHVLIFDEFPVMAKAILDRDVREAAALLRWLRVERQRDGAPRMLLAGSTSLPELCRQANLSDTINDLQLLPLPPFDAATASALLRDVFETERVEVDAESIEAMVEAVGPEVPFFLQLLAVELLRHGGGRVTPALVRRLYQERLLSADNRSRLDDFRGRLDRSYLPNERDVALAVLRELARHRRGLELRALRNAVVAQGLDEGVLERVLGLLEGDFYVAQDEAGSYRFANRYLADWWQRFHA